MRVYLSTRQRLTLESTPFASGGQGLIYRFDARVHPALRLRLAKILKPHANSPDYEARIEYLCAHRPALSSLPNPDCLAWPEQCLYDQFGKFIGFTQPYVGGAIELENLCALAGTTDPRFARLSGPTASARSQRMRVARNLADALAAMEAAGDYVSTDLKPQNILVKPTAEVSLIDLDNLQISEQGSVLFRTTGFTDEYPPPEFYQGRVDLKTDRANKSFERFSLAVILYRLLFGIHPFMGTSSASDLLDAIRRGYFAGGPTRNRFTVIPPPHREFDAADPSLRQLFLLAFDDGTKAAQRPTAQQWSAVLAQLGARPATVSTKHARAAWAAQHGISVPPSSSVKGWDNASIWNPHPARRAGYRSVDLFVDPTVCDVVQVDDPVSGVRLKAVIHDIWLVYVFTPAVVGKRVILSYQLPSTLRGTSNFAGKGWFGRSLPPIGDCVRDIYRDFAFELRYCPRSAALFSKERLRPTRLALQVEVVPFKPNRPLALQGQHPSLALPGRVQQPMQLQPHRMVPFRQTEGLRPTAKDALLHGTAAASGPVAALKSVQPLRRPFCPRCGALLVAGSHPWVKNRGTM